MDNLAKMSLFDSNAEVNSLFDILVIARFASWKRCLTSLICFFCLIAIAGRAAASPAQESSGKLPTPADYCSVPHAQIRLLSDSSAIIPGRPFKVGLVFILEKGWHIYYRDSGQAGMPTRIKWELPPGFSVSDLLWEPPKIFRDAGITTNGYSDTTTIGAIVTPPPSLSLGRSVHIKANASFLT